MTWLLVAIVIAVAAELATVFYIAKLIRRSEKDNG